VIIDADTHVSAVKFDSLAIDAEQLIAMMDRSAVDKAVVWLKPPYDRDVSRENRYVRDAALRYPDRLLPFGWANPRLGVGKAREEIARCLDDFGMHGVKFNGAQDDHRIDEPDTLGLVGEVVGRGKIAAFHVGADSPENTHPYRLGRIAEKYPEGQFLLILIGGAALPPLARAAIEVAREHPNITLVGSAVTEMEIHAAISQLGPERVAFGSDVPFRMMHVQLAAYQALLSDFGDGAAEMVLGGNVARLLGLHLS
jgi:predicted TIM-barrel fold metal-dependent hydrolase